MNLHAKFQPPSFNTVDGDEHTTLYFSTIPLRITKHPLLASLRRDNKNYKMAI